MPSSEISGGTKTSPPAKFQSSCVPQSTQRFMPRWFIHSVSLFACLMLRMTASFRSISESIAVIIVQEVRDREHGAAAVSPLLCAAPAIGPGPRGGALAFILLKGEKYPPFGGYAAPFYPISSSYTVVEPKKRAADPHRRKESLLIKTTTSEQQQCKVRSRTSIPCLRPAVVKVRGIPFCEPCAREQEAYFAIGELTEAPEGLREGALVELVNRMRRTTRTRRRRRVH